MTPFILVLTLFAFALITLGFVIKEYTLGVLGSMLLILLGVAFIIYGVADINNFLTDCLGYIFIGVGAYILIRGSIEKF